MIFTRLIGIIISVRICMKFKSNSLDEMKQNYPEKNWEKACKYGAIDLKNKKFGTLTPIYYATHNNRNGWVCKCDCGRYTFYNTDKLISGEAQSCGADCPCKKTKIHNLIGQKFGRLTVLERSGITTDGHARWKCKCDCGTITYVSGRYLESGKISSCGNCPDKIKSKGNLNIKEYLMKNNINFQQEYRISNFLKYPFDFAILDKNNNIQFLIEYQGIQHFKPTSGWFDQESVDSCKERDEIKRKYCEDHNIKLYYITYLQDTIKELKEILDNKKQ